jgi:hypothetical protein
MTEVQSRFLQILLSPVTGDRVTVGVVHWDGIALRAAASFDHLPTSLASEKPVLEPAVDALIRRARTAGRNATWSSRQRSILQLSDVFEVRTGLGARLCWTGVRISETDDADSHFRKLCDLAGVKEPGTKLDVAITRALRKDLVAIGKRLESKSAGRVLTNQLVRQKHAFRCPLSWKNGEWHHTVLANFARSTEQGMVEEANAVFGRVRLSVPVEDKVIVLAVLPDDAALSKTAKREAELLRDVAADVWQESVAERPKLVARLETRVRSDVLDATH